MQDYLHFNQTGELDECLNSILMIGSNLNSTSFNSIEIFSIQLCQPGHEMTVCCQFYFNLLKNMLRYMLWCALAAVRLMQRTMKSPLTRRGGGRSQLCSQHPRETTVKISHMMRGCLISPTQTGRQRQQRQGARSKLCCRYKIHLI